MAKIFIQRLNWDAFEIFKIKKVFQSYFSRRFIAMNNFVVFVIFSSLFCRTCRLLDADQHVDHGRRLDRVGLPKAKHQSHEATRNHSSNYFLYLHAWNLRSKVKSDYLLNHSFYFFSISHYCFKVLMDLFSYLLYLKFHRLFTICHKNLMKF